MASWHRQLTPQVLEQLDNRIEDLRALLIMHLLGKSPGNSTIARNVNEVLSIACMPEEVWMKEQ